MYFKAKITRKHLKWAGYPAQRRRKEECCLGLVREMDVMRQWEWVTHILLTFRHLSGHRVRVHRAVCFQSRCDRNHSSCGSIDGCQQVRRAPLRSLFPLSSTATCTVHCLKRRKKTKEVEEEMFWVGLWQVIPKLPYHLFSLSLYLYLPLSHTHTLTNSLSNTPNLTLSHTYIHTSTPSYQPLSLTHTLSHAVSVWDSCCSQSYSHTQTGFVQMENTHTHTHIRPHSQSSSCFPAHSPSTALKCVCPPRSCYLHHAGRQDISYGSISLPLSFVLC